MSGTKSGNAGPINSRNNRSSKTQDERENPSTETDPELTHTLKSADKEIQTVTGDVFHYVQKVEMGGMFKKIQLSF